VLFKGSEEFERIFYNFSLEDNVHCDAPYTTLLIGSNGTGKSRLLKGVIDIFNDLHNHNSSVNIAKPAMNSGFEICYFIGNDKIMVNYDRFEYELYINGIQTHISNILLPDKGIVASYSLHEKFIPKEDSIFQKSRGNRYDNSFYEYLGIKSQRNFAFSSANISKSLDLITAAISEKGFDKDLLQVFKTLRFNPALTITYIVKKNRELFAGNLTSYEVRKVLEESDYKKSGFSYSTLSSLGVADDDFLEEVTQSLNQIANTFKEKFRFSIDISFDQSSSNNDLTRIYKDISLLRKLNLLSYGKIDVYKENASQLFGQSQDLHTMSSGEIHLITSLLSLAAVVKNNSLILIDEPEISLHPNWQIKYMDLINRIFKSSKGCHFIIASHSHFLASNLLPNSSSILLLKEAKNGKIKAEVLESAYGWSAENVLYNVFGVATTRNHYFEVDLNKLLKLISERSNRLEDIILLTNKFKQFKLNDDDPLSLLIRDAESYVATKKG